MASLSTAGEHREGFLGSVSIRFILDGSDTGGAFSVNEKTMSPRALAAPLHRHTREDEYTLVVSGRVGVLTGDEVIIGEEGDVIFRPRGAWHTFWNAGDIPARMIEIVAPAGLEEMFHELADADGETTPAVLDEMYRRHELEMDPDSVPRLMERFGLRFPGERL